MDKVLSDTFFEKKMSFEDSEFEVFEEGRVVVKTIVHDSDCNPYGFAHGGYLFALCDEVAGLVGYSNGFYAVSQQASFSFLRSVSNKEEIYVEGTSLHAGKSTQVIEVVVKNNEGKLFCKGMFTLFNLTVVSKNEED